MTTTATVTITNGRIIIDLPDEAMTEAMRFLAKEEYATILQAFYVHYDQIVLRREGTECDLLSVIVGAGGRK